MQFALKAVTLKTTVETRFVYLYDVVRAVLKRWEPIRSALQVAAAAGGAPTLTAADKANAEAVRDIIGPIRHAMVGTTLCCSTLIVCPSCQSVRQLGAYALQLLFLFPHTLLDCAVRQQVRFPPQVRQRVAPHA